MTRGEARAQIVIWDLLPREVCAVWGARRAVHVA